MRTTPSRASRTLGRRHFLMGTSAAALACSLPSTVTAASPDGLRIAVIGVRGRGRSHLDGLRDHVVALCDVDEKVLDATVDEYSEKLGRKLERFVDYRRIMERADIDAVAIATPNHTHSLIGIAACEAGKSVYVEKPVSHNVWEGRQLAKAARKFGTVVQCGTQSRSSKSLQEAVAYVRSGALGKIEYAVGTCFKPRPSIGKLSQPLQIPQHVHYDLWCGPAAKLDLYRPKLHYDWHWDFNTGNGDMGNQGIHQMDIARWFLGYDTVAPAVISVGGRVGYEDAGNTPNTQVVYHDYPEAPLIFETRGLPESKKAQEKWSPMDRYRGSSIGVIVQCERGHVLIPNYTSATAYDRDGEVIKKWQGGGDHFANFVQAATQQDPGKLNAEILEGHLSSALCHTGGVSHQLGAPATTDAILERVGDRPRLKSSVERMLVHLQANEVSLDGKALRLGPWLKMDPQEETFLNNEDANALLRREYRSEFVVPEIA